MLSWKPIKRFGLLFTYLDLNFTFRNLTHSFIILGRFKYKLYKLHLFWRTFIQRTVKTVLTLENSELVQFICGPLVFQKLH